ncbi:MAG: hypothetical protein RL226_1294 [Bacteroidota bacterium]
MRITSALGRPLVIGLTGGIGSGKTLVGRVFHALGCDLYISDQEAKKVYNDEGVKESVLCLLGPQSYQMESPDFAYISSQVFQDDQKLTALNGIIHPAVKRRFSTFVARASVGSIIIKETAILFESKGAEDCDFVITVNARQESRIERVKNRDGHTEEHIHERMAKQMRDGERSKLSDFTISNNNEDMVLPQVISIIDQLKVSGKVQIH